MKIGIKIGPAKERGVMDLAKAGETLGFHSVWVSERVAVPLDRPHPYEPSVDPWITLAFVAAVTERVILGTSVSQIALRPPVLMARELATLDRLSEGRLIVGAGAGWVQEEFTTTGVPFETRGGRLNEFIQALRHLWTAPEDPWRGKFFDIPAAGLIKPFTPGGPPIYLGAAGPPGLRRAARYGDGFIATALPPETLRVLRSRLLELLEKNGRAEHFPFFAQTLPPSSAEQARALVEQHREAGVEGLIVTSADAVSGAAFLRNEELVGALLEAARHSK